MKTLMISTDTKIFEPGSAVRERMIERARSLEELHIIVFSKENFKIQISNFKSNPKSKCQNEIVISSNCWVYPTRSLLKMLNPLSATRLGRFIIERRKITDITCQDPFLTAMAAISLKKQFNIPLEIQIHTDIGSPNYTKAFTNRIRKVLALSYLPKADSIRVVSNRIKAYLVDSLKIDQTKIEVRPIQIDVQWIKNAPVIESADLHKRYQQFERIILMASRLEKEKNIALAIRAFSEVIKKLPKTALIIVGEGSEARYLRSCALRLAPRNVFFESWADKDVLASYYKTTDLFLVTSLFEGYGMTLVEAQAAGCKIVSTDVGVAKEVGAIIVKDDAVELAETLVNVLSMKAS
ncbi:MAG: glycosyltransferase family 4 protein [Candidatus Taylorbacteria bacterium]|nr:glycosyltransferase family 4 protein [Candidatus Taylorbacteria bacterium]